MTQLSTSPTPPTPRLDDFRDLNSVDRRPDLPTGKGLVIAEGVLVVQRMLASRFTPHALLGTDRRLARAGRRPGRRTGAPLLSRHRRGDGRRGRLPPQPRGAGGGAAAGRADRRRGARRRAHRRGARRRQRPREPRLDLPQRGRARRRRGRLRHRLRRPAVPARGAGVDGPCPAGAVRLGDSVAGRPDRSCATTDFGCWP